MPRSSKSARDNRANQLNSKHPAYHLLRGASPGEAQRIAEHGKPMPGNHAVPPDAHDTNESSRGEAIASSTGSSNPSSVKSE
jgi:hypothetical protein